MLSVRCRKNEIWFGIPRAIQRTNMLRDPITFCLAVKSTRPFLLLRKSTINFYLNFSHNCNWIFVDNNPYEDFCMLFLTQLHIGKVEKQISPDRFFYFFSGSPMVMEEPCCIPSAYFQNSCHFIISFSEATDRKSLSPTQ